MDTMALAIGSREVIVKIFKSYLDRRVHVNKVKSKNSEFKRSYWYLKRIFFDFLLLTLKNLFPHLERVSVLMVVIGFVIFFAH